jgi:two-component system response regulator HydG
MAEATLDAQAGDGLTGIATLATESGYVPITEPLIAAFEVGRQLNRLSFHLQQAWFFTGDRHVNAAQEAAAALRRVYAVLLPVPQQDQAQRCISARVEGLIGQLRSKQHLDDLTNSEQELKDLSRRGELEDHPVERRRQVLEPVFEVVNNLRQLLLPGHGVQTDGGRQLELLVAQGVYPSAPLLDGPMVLALRLGELLDQGLCPPEIYLYMDGDADAERSAGEADVPPEVGVDPWQKVGAVPRRIEEKNLLALKSYLPGERPLPAGWLDDVRQLWAELGLPGSLSPEALQMPESDAREVQQNRNREQDIDQLAKRMHEGLSSVMRAGAGPAEKQTSALPGGVPLSAEAVDHRKSQPDEPGTAIRSETSESEAPRASAAGPSGVPEASLTSAGRASPLVTVPVSKQRFEELLALKKRMDPEGKYIGESLPILLAIEKIADFNKTPNAPVLILGPSGAGKTEIAELIHRASSRKDRPFHREQASDNKGSDMALAKGRWAGYGENSGLSGIPKEGVKGLLQQCAGGTIFFDEITQSNRDFQTFLLDVIDGQLIPLTAGQGPLVKADVRVIAATNDDPDEAVKDGKLKGDLWRRLRSWTVRIPTLAERKSDIFLFVDALCNSHTPKPEFLLALLRYSWPGNVGELCDVLQRALGRTGRKNGTLTLDHLELHDPSIIEEVRQMHERQVEQEVYQKLMLMLRDQGLEKGHGLQKRMAVLLKVSPSTVTRVLQEIDK